MEVTSLDARSTSRKHTGVEIGPGVDKEITDAIWRLMTLFNHTLLQNYLQ
jgi:hypothetical protein